MRPLGALNFLFQNHIAPRISTIFRYQKVRSVQGNHFFIIIFRNPGKFDDFLPTYFLNIALRNMWNVDFPEHAENLNDGSPLKTAR